MRSLKKKFKLEDLNVDYTKDRVDRNMLNSDEKSIIFCIDLDAHKDGLKEGIRKTYATMQIVEKHFPGQFFWRFSGRGFHGLSLIELDDDLDKKLLSQGNISIWDFMIGLVWGIIKKCDLTENEIDLFLYKRNGMIRGFCKNEHAMLNDKPLYCVPIQPSESLDSIVSKSLLLKDFPTELVLNKFRDFEVFMRPPRREQIDAMDLIPEAIKGISIQGVVELEKLYVNFPPCIKYLFHRQYHNYDTIFPLMLFLYSLGLRKRELYLVATDIVSSAKMHPLFLEETQLEYVVTLST